MQLSVGSENLLFEMVPLHFGVMSVNDVYARKNNRTLEDTIRQPRYRRIEQDARNLYGDLLTVPLGTFLLERKQNKDSFYKRFLNAYGDGVFCDFSLGDPSRAKLKGLYAFTVGANSVVYIGRCRDSFRKRIDQGYGHIYPKNCYLDGQATNCRLNALIAKHQKKLTFYVCPMTENNEIVRLEQELIQTHVPIWNIALKGVRGHDRRSGVDGTWPNEIAPIKPKRPRDTNQLAKFIVDLTTDDEPDSQRAVTSLNRSNHIKLPQNTSNRKSKVTKPD